MKSCDPTNYYAYMDSFLPLRLLNTKLQVEKNLSERSHFDSLLCLGEFTLKITTCALIAAIQNTSENHRHQQIYEIYHSSGIGGWAYTIESILTGPSAQFLNNHSRDLQEELTILFSNGSWQYEVICEMQKALSKVKSVQKVNHEIQLKQWISLFVTLRNKTKGHGALSETTLSSLIKPLFNALQTLISNSVLFKYEWAHLYRNLSGKFRVTPLKSESNKFSYLKSEKNNDLNDGIYIYFGKPVRVELLDYDLDAMDFYLPNAKIRKNKVEYISYITGKTKKIDCSTYNIDFKSLPHSHTEGIGNLSPTNSVFSNMPSVPSKYINRPRIEDELSRLLDDDYHPIISLHGRGGIGKTTLSLSVLHKLSNSERFFLIIWLSARDIDLLENGPKQVKPDVITRKDIANKVVDLMKPGEANVKGFDSVSWLTRMMTKSDIGPILFVLDNFETIYEPKEIYSWIDNSIRNPNKILITTRNRFFKGDYPIHVKGMELSEFSKLTVTQSKFLGIKYLITDSYISDLFKDSDGHPYIVKVFLSVVAQQKKRITLKQYIATRDDILTSLFERTYSLLDKQSKRIFLLCSKWNLPLPKFLLSAVLIRVKHHDEFQFDDYYIDQRLEELERTSLIEILSDSESQMISIPLTARAFSKRKFAVYPHRVDIETDVEFLKLFNVSYSSERFDRQFQPFLSELENMIINDKDITEILGVIEHISKSNATGWYLLGKSMYRFREKSVFFMDSALKYLYKYIEQNPKENIINTWKSIAIIHFAKREWKEYINAEISLTEVPDCDLFSVSIAAASVSEAIKKYSLVIEEKKHIVNKLINQLETRIDEFSSVDYSRLSWLYLLNNQKQKAKESTAKGLALNPHCEYCFNLYEKLEESNI